MELDNRAWRKLAMIFIAMALFIPLVTSFAGISNDYSINKTTIGVSGGTGTGLYSARFTTTPYQPGSYPAINNEQTANIGWYDITRGNVEPNITQIYITSSSGNNYSADSITCWVNTTDLDNQTLVVYFNWYNNTVQIPSLSGYINVNRDSLTNISTLAPSNTTTGENWTCEAKTWDGYFNETDWNNASIIIRAPPPPPGGSAGAAMGLPIGIIPRNISQCIEAWTCTFWSECINGNKTRICIDYNDCGTEEFKPEGTQECKIPVKPGIVTEEPAPTEPSIVEKSADKAKDALKHIIKRISYTIQKTTEKIKTIAISITTWITPDRIEFILIILIYLLLIAAAIVLTKYFIRQYFKDITSRHLRRKACLMLEISIIALTAHYLRFRQDACPAYISVLAMIALLGLDWIIRTQPSRIRRKIREQERVREKIEGYGEYLKETEGISTRIKRFLEKPAPPTAPKPPKQTKFQQLKQTITQIKTIHTKLAKPTTATKETIPKILKDIAKTHLPEKLKTTTQLQQQIKEYIQQKRKQKQQKKLEKEQKAKQEKLLQKYKEYLEETEGVSARIKRYLEKPTPPTAPKPPKQTKFQQLKQKITQIKTIKPIAATKEPISKILKDLAEPHLPEKLKTTTQLQQQIKEYIQQKRKQKQQKRLEKEKIQKQRKLEKAKLEKQKRTEREQQRLEKQKIKEQKRKEKEQKAKQEKLQKQYKKYLKETEGVSARIKRYLEKPTPPTAPKPPKQTKFQQLKQTITQIKTIHTKLAKPTTATKETIPKILKDIAKTHLPEKLKTTTQLQQQIKEYIQQKRKQKQQKRLEKQEKKEIKRQQKEKEKSREQKRKEKEQRTEQEIKEQKRTEKEQKRLEKQERKEIKRKQKEQRIKATEQEQQKTRKLEGERLKKQKEQQRQIRNAQRKEKQRLSELRKIGDFNKNLKRYLSKPILEKEKSIKHTKFQQLKQTIMQINETGALPELERQKDIEQKSKEKKFERQKIKEQKRIEKEQKRLEKERIRKKKEKLRKRIKEQRKIEKEQIKSERQKRKEKKRKEKQRIKELDKFEDFNKELKEYLTKPIPKPQKRKTKKKTKFDKLYEEITHLD